MPATPESLLSHAKTYIKVKLEFGTNLAVKLNKNFSLFLDLISRFEKFLGNYFPLSFSNGMRSMLQFLALSI